LTRPEARPASFSGTPVVEARITAMNANAAPTPKISIPGRTSSRKLPPTGARAKSRRPRAIMLSPPSIVGFMPKRLTAQAEGPWEIAPSAMVAGR
jgi:hypothetical protein